MPATEKQRAWTGHDIPVRSAFRYGELNDRTTVCAVIESTVELNDKEVEKIRDGTRKNQARYAIVRPASGAPGFLDVEYRAARPFERIRRITGYLTGSLDTWNSAKRAEERDRVKHGLPHPEEEVNLHIKEAK